MAYDRSRHHRRSIRRRGYDYAQPGADFVTLCTQGRQPWFGVFNNHDLVLSATGHMVVRWWQALNQKFPTISTDAFVVMTTTEYIRQVKQSAWPAFDRRVWPRDYYEHIIRDDGSLDRIRRFIAANPARAVNGRDDIDALLARMHVAAD